MTAHNLTMVFLCLIFSFLFGGGFALLTGSIGAAITIHLSILIVCIAAYTDSALLVGWFLIPLIPFFFFSLMGAALGREAFSKVSSNSRRRRLGAGLLVGAFICVTVAALLFQAGSQ